MQKIQVIKVEGKFDGSTVNSIVSQVCTYVGTGVTSLEIVISVPPNDIEMQEIIMLYNYIGILPAQINVSVNENYIHGILKVLLCCCGNYKDMRKSLEGEHSVFPITLHIKCELDIDRFKATIVKEKFVFKSLSNIIANELKIDKDVENNIYKALCGEIEPYTFSV